MFNYFSHINDENYILNNNNNSHKFLQIFFIKNKELNLDNLFKNVIKSKTYLN